MKKYIAGLLLAFIATGAMAVDGYKGVKFGSSFNTLQSAKFCDFQKASNQPDNKNIVMYNCMNFQFADSNTMAAASFIDGKFVKLQIIVDPPLDPIIKALYNKYGTPSSSSTKDDIQNAAVTGSPVYIRFDKGTVFLKVEKVNKIDVVSLNYVSPDFEPSIEQQQVKKIADDI